LKAVGEADGTDIARKRTLSSQLDVDDNFVGTVSQQTTAHSVNDELHSPTAVQLTTFGCQTTTPLRQINATDANSSWMMQLVSSGISYMDGSTSSIIAGRQS